MAQQDACTLLDEDHVKVEQLFQQYSAAGDDARKRELARQICQELRVHIEIENEIFYPAFRQATQDNQLVKHSLHEHDEALSLIGTIEAARQPHDQTMKTLESAIRDHVKDEREKMFPEARKAPGMDLTRLADQLQARKAELMAGHPV
jgi:hemerythrin-like domain-containing protein